MFWFYFLESFTCSNGHNILYGSSAMVKVLLKLYVVFSSNVQLTVMSPPLVLPLCPPPSLANIPLTPETARDQERRIRREIANSNERRRMQSINSGFQSLKTLIPHSDGEKLSKVGHRERFEPGNELDVAVRVWTHLQNRTVTLFFFFFSPGCHPATDSRVHFYFGAGEDAAIAAEQSAQTNHTGKASPRQTWNYEQSQAFLSFSIISFSIPLKQISNFCLCFLRS